MKWFKHDTDMHSDLKVQILIDRHGLEGYAIFNLCLEMVGKEGKKGKIDGQLRWRQLLLKVARWSNEDKLESILSTMIEVRLICSKSYKYGNLYIPKFIKRADDYTARKLRTLSEQGMNNVHVDKKRLEEIRTEYIKIKGWLEEDLISSDYARYANSIKELLLRTKGNADRVIKAMHWIATQGYEWTLETINKKWADFAKREKRQEAQIQRSAEAQRKLEQMRKEAKQEKPIDPTALKELTDKIGEI